jgi:hypothetical protein
MGIASSTHGLEPHITFWCETLNKREYYEDLCADWMILLKWIIKNSMIGCAIESSGSN